METHGPTFIRSSSERGEAIVAMPVPAVIFLAFRGHVDTELTKRVIEELERVAAGHTRVAVFNDMEQVTGYDSGFRVIMNTWGTANAARFPSVHVLFRSKLVAMGIAVSNLALGGMLTPHASRQGFEARMREAGVLEPPRFP